MNYVPTKTRHRFKYGLQWLAMRAGVGVLSWIPVRVRVPLLSVAARIAGTLLFDGIARKNLKICFGDKLDSSLRREIRRANDRAIGRLVSELVDYRRLGAPYAARMVRTDATLQFLDDALARGRGAVVVTPHFGNWELFPSHLAGRGYKGAVVARNPANPHLAREFIQMRARAGVETLDALGNARRILRILESGGVAGLLPDLDSKHVAGTFVPFFGTPAWTPVGPAHISVMAGAPLVTAYMIPDGEYYQLVFEEAILPQPGVEKKGEIARITALWAARFEARIRKDPALWVWMHDRFATTPEKAAERKLRKKRR